MAKTAELRQRWREHRLDLKYWDLCYKKYGELLYGTDPAHFVQTVVWPWIRRTGCIYPSILQVLEIGCGAGRNLMYLFKRLRKEMPWCTVHLIGMDFSKRAVEIAVQRAHEVGVAPPHSVQIYSLDLLELIQGRASSLTPLEVPNSNHVIYANYIFDQIPIFDFLPQIFRYFKKILAPQGLLMFNVECLCDHHKDSAILFESDTYMEINAEGKVKTVFKSKESAWKYFANHFRENHFEVLKVGASWETEHIRGVPRETHYCYFVLKDTSTAR